MGWHALSAVGYAPASGCHADAQAARRELRAAASGSAALQQQVAGLQDAAQAASHLAAEAELALQVSHAACASTPLQLSASMCDHAQAARREPPAVPGSLASLQRQVAGLQAAVRGARQRAGKNKVALEVSHAFWQCLAA